MAIEAITQSIGIFRSGENMENNQFQAVRFNIFNRWQLASTAGTGGIVVNVPKSGEVANVVVFGVTKARLANTVISGRQLTSNDESKFVEGAGPVIAMENGSAGDIISVFISVSKSDIGTFPWQILSKELFIIPDRRQVSIHGILEVDGVLILNGSAQLTIEN